MTYRMTYRMPPRRVPSRDEKYMGLAVVYAEFSKDPLSQLGAVIVNQHNQVISTGYNGPPRLFDDQEINWVRPGKNLYIRHAEANALDRTKKRLNKCTLYVTGLPCEICMNYIISKEVKRVVYLERPAVPGSMLSDPAVRERTLELVERAKGQVLLEEFSGRLDWLSRSQKKLKETGLFDKYILWD